jgi:lysophospholipase L1-like esterase
MHRIQRYSIPAVIIAVIVAVWYARSGTPTAASPTTGSTIIAFGDSLVQGHGASPGRDVVSVLEKRLGTNIINAGRGGDTTAAALARLDRDVLSRNPRIVMVLLGGNDFLRRVPHHETLANLDAIVSRIRGRGAAVVIVGISAGLFGDPYVDGLTDLAWRTSSGLVTDILGGIMGNGALMADAIHPNDRGYEVMADRLEPVLRELVRRTER